MILGRYLMKIVFQHFLVGQQPFCVFFLFKKSVLSLQ
jgi:hypothetical protein